MSATYARMFLIGRFPVSSSEVMVRRFVNDHWTKPSPGAPVSNTYTFEVDHDLNRSTSVITGVIKFDEAVAFIM